MSWVSTLAGTSPRAGKRVCVSSSSSSLSSSPSSCSSANWGWQLHGVWLGCRCSQPDSCTIRAPSAHARTHTGGHAGSQAAWSPSQYDVQVFSNQHMQCVLTQTVHALKWSAYYPQAVLCSCFLPTAWCTACKKCTKMHVKTTRQADARWETSDAGFMLIFLHHRMGLNHEMQLNISHWAFKEMCF